MPYGFTKGGFAVVDDSARIGIFAYATSLNWYQAKRENNSEKTAVEMLKGAWAKCPDNLRESHYLQICGELEAC